MTTLELGTFIVLLLVTAIGTWRLLARQRQDELQAGRAPGSASFASAAASTLLALKLDPLIGPKSVLFLPVGDGMYPARTGMVKGRAWRRTLESWLSRGAIINLIVTVPNASARETWRALERFRNFRYYELERHLATADLAGQIARLDTYHPILLASTDGSGPQAMWIEQYHPLDSPYAYAVQYVAPADIKGDERFGAFLALYRRLLSGGNHVRVGTRPQEQREVLADVA
jgi:hypothetical protein